MYLDNNNTEYSKLTPEIDELLLLKKLVYVKIFLNFEHSSTTKIYDRKKKEKGGKFVAFRSN